MFSPFCCTRDVGLCTETPLRYHVPETSGPWEPSQEKFGVTDSACAQRSASASPASHLLLSEKDRPAGTPAVVSQRSMHGRRERRAWKSKVSLRLRRRSTGAYVALPHYGTVSGTVHAHKLPQSRTGSQLFLLWGGGPTHRKPVVVPSSHLHHLFALTAPSAGRGLPPPLPG